MFHLTCHWRSERFPRSLRQVQCWQTPHPASGQANKIKGGKQGKVPLRNPYWVSSCEIRSRNRTGAIWGQCESAVGSKRDLRGYFRSSGLPHSFPGKAAATDPAGSESQTLQACHPYLCPLPISRVTASSSCLPRGENAKSGELTQSRPRAGFGATPLSTLCTPPAPPDCWGEMGEQEICCEARN